MKTFIVHPINNIAEFEIVHADQLQMSSIPQVEDNLVVIEFNNDQEAIDHLAAQDPAIDYTTRYELKLCKLPSGS